MFAVEAALFASDNESDDGSLWNERAVLTAACFWAHVVPWLGAGAGAVVAGDAEDGDDMRAKRDCSSLNCAGGVAVPPAGCGLRGGGLGGEAVRPMLNPGTETPDWPSLCRESWFGAVYWAASV